MGNGINLSLTKSLAKFDALLDEAIEAAASGKLSTLNRPHKSRGIPPTIEDVFGSIFSMKPPAAHGGSDGSLSEDEIDALLSGADAPRAGFANLSAVHEFNDDNVGNYRVGKYVKMGSDKNPLVFWIGYGWEENGKSESRLWLEFDAKHCPAKHWENLYKLVGTSGKYYPEIGFEFVQKYINAWIRFCLREEYLKQFYDENAGMDSQGEILTGFINEVVEKL